MVIACGNAGVGAGNADGGKTGLVKGLGSRNGNAGTIRAENQSNTRVNELGSSRNRLRLVRAVVGIYQLNIVSYTADFNSGGLGICKLHTEHFLLAACAGVAGSGLEHADLNDVFAFGRSCGSVTISRGGFRRSGRAACKHCNEQ